MTYTFSVLVALYNVEKYVDAFLVSLERQLHPLSDIEIIAVDDGSTDGTHAIVERWARSRTNVTLLQQENSGAGSARAAALARATGEWITVIDPDDIVDRDYFSAVASFLSRDAAGAASMLVSRVYILNDATGRFSDTHPLGAKFRYGDRLARLADEPEAFQLGATAFLQRDVLVKNGLTYDANIKPTFEDAHLLGRYLRTFDDPVVGLVSSAHYYYRKRSANDSLVQSSWSTEERFLVVPRLGYLDMLRKITRDGCAPIWAQYMVLYDILWFYRADQELNSKVGWIDGEVRSEFLEVFGEVMRYIEPATIERFACNPVPWPMRQSLLVHYSPNPLDRARIFRWANDSIGNAQFTLFYRWPRPSVVVFVDGVRRARDVTNYTAHTYFDVLHAVEESFTVPVGETTVWVDGVLVTPGAFRRPQWGRPDTRTAPRLGAAVRGAPGPVVKRAISLRRRVEVDALTRRTTRAAVMAEMARRALEAPARRRQVDRRSDEIETIKVEAALDSVRQRYSEAWVIMDRPGKADDNGEHFYRYLQQQEPEVNAFFFLLRSSSDWDRLEQEGFRLIEYGSREAALITLNAQYRISSDATADVMHPIPRAEYGQTPGKFIFLQHGVTHNDLSRWLNPKRIDLIVTSTRDEHESFVGALSPYRFRPSQVVMAGFSRHDTLLRKRISRIEHRTIFVMPTWRRELRDLLAAAVSQAEAIILFEESDFGREWLELLRSDMLKDFAARHGCQVVFALHPSLDGLLDEFDLPTNVRRLRSGDFAFQDVLAGSALLLTDYSSVAFDAAYIGVPTVYFQFDKESMFGGAQNYRSGYFDYQDDGFGPVVHDVEGMADAFDELELSGLAMPSHFRERRDLTFARRDAQNSERIYQAICALGPHEGEAS